MVNQFRLSQCAYSHSQTRTGSSLLCAAVLLYQLKKESCKYMYALTPKRRQYQGRHPLSKPLEFLFPPISGWITRYRLRYKSAFSLLLLQLCMRTTHWASQEMDLTSRPSLSLGAWVAGCHWRHLTIYLTIGTKGKRQTVQTGQTLGGGGTYMSRCVDVERAWFWREIAHGSSTEGGHSAVGVSPQKEFHRSSEKNDNLLH